MLKLLVERPDEVEGSLRLDLQAPDIVAQERPRLRRFEVGRQLLFQLRLVFERPVARVFVDKKIERIDRGHVRHEIDRHLELVRLFGKDEPRQIIAERILLPVDEVVFRRDVQRVRQDRRARMRRGPEPHDLRAEGGEPVVDIFRAVGQRDVEGHRVSWGGGLDSFRGTVLCLSRACKLHA